MQKIKQTKMPDPQYFQGVLQLRNPNEEVFKLIKNQLKKRPDVWIAKEEKQKNGTDLYFSSNRFLLALGKRIKKSYKGELKISKKIHTRNKMTSRDVYRMTVLFRFE